MEEANYDDIRIDVTETVIHTINTNKELYSGFVKARKQSNDKDVQVDNVAQLCYEYAEAHNNEFGDLFQTELDFTDWEEVLRVV